MDEEEDEEEEEEEESVEERHVQLRVRYAFNIPKVDMLSESDPYVVLQLPGRSRKPCRTVTIQDEPNPVWEEDFFFDCPCRSNGRLQGVIELEVMDEDMISDSLIGKSTLDLGRYDAEEWGMIELPLVLVDKVKIMFEKQMKKKQSKGFLSLGRKTDQPPQDFAREHAPCLVLAIVGAIPSFAMVQQLVPDLPDVVVDPKTRMVLVPLPGYPVLAGIQYGGNPRKGPRFRLVSSQAWTILSTGVRLDFQLPPGMPVLPAKPAQAGNRDSMERGDSEPAKSRASFRSTQEAGGEGAGGACASPHIAAVVERMQWPRGKRLTPDLRVYEEVALVGLPLSADLGELLVTLAPKLPTVAAYDVCALLTGAGWNGPGSSFKVDLAAMKDSIADASSSKQELYVMTDGEIPPCCVLALDYRNPESTPLGASPHIVAYLNKSSALYWELHSEGDAATQSKEVHYARSISVMKGESRFRSKQRLQLCDPEGRLACQEDLGGLQLLGFEIDYDRCSTWSLRSVLEGDFGAEEEPEEVKDGPASKLLSKFKTSMLGSLLQLVGLGKKSKSPPG